MAGFYSLDNREVVRVKVKKCDGLVQPEYKKFSLDPQITSFEMLQNILARAFDIKGDYTISYLSRDDDGQEVYLSMLSDWDMDASFQAASDPYLKLKVDLKPFEEGLDDWDIIAPAEIPQYKITNLIDRSSFLGSLTGSISTHMEKTVTQVQKVMGLKAENEVQYRPPKLPMTDMEFRNYLDSDGHMVRPQEFRLSIYQGGVEPSLRRVVWRHLLNVFPVDLSGRERFDYIKQKEKEYYKLRDQWKEQFSSGSPCEELKFVTTMVKKDVLRTDRTHKFYAGADDSKNLVSLFHILVTYALTHPEVSYCQGMSDIASPLLVVQKDEAQAYLCLCSAMRRLKRNFLTDGSSITTKFQHLSDLIQLHDPVFSAYLRECHAEDLFFCYRWVLLELKREFPFEDALYMLEVMWSTLPPDPPDRDLPLTDSDYSAAMLSTSPNSPTFSFKQTVYAKLLAKRRHLQLVKPKEIPKHLPLPDSEKEEIMANNSVNNNSRIADHSPSPSDDDIAGSQEYPNMEDPIVRVLHARSISIDKSLEEAGNRENECTGIPEVADSQTSKVGAVLERIPESEPGEVSHVTDNSPAEQASEKQIDGDIPACNSEEVHGDQEELQVGNSDEVVGDGESQSQFYISLEASAETQKQEEKVQEKKERTSFFTPLKRLLSSPKKQPGTVQPQVTIASNEGKVDPTKKSNGTEISNQVIRNGTTLNSGRSQSPTLPQNTKNVDIDMNRNKNNMNGPKENVITNGVAGMHVSDCAEVSDDSSIELLNNCNNLPKLPPPHEFGHGNPFLMFECLTLLLQHRDHIMRNRMEYDELAMYFDKMVRKHNVHKVLHQARILYSDYLRSEQRISEQESSGEFDLSV